MTKALPCPVCGAAALVLNRQYRSRSATFVACPNRGDTCVFRAHFFRPAATAVERWNLAVREHGDGEGKLTHLADETARPGQLRRRDPPRCPQCHLMLSADGTCFDCPCDPARMRRLTQEQPGAEGDDVLGGGNFTHLKR